MLAVVRAIGDGRILVAATDESAAQRMEAARRDFVANVSHELKTPVAAMGLLAEATVDAADDPDAVRRFAGKLQSEAVRLGALVNELIALSRLQGADPLPGPGGASRSTRSSRRPFPGWRRPPRTPASR